jgi:hypothetical protein
MGARLWMAWRWFLQVMANLSDGSGAYQDYIDLRFARLEAAVFPKTEKAEEHVADLVIPPANMK